MYSSCLPWLCPWSSWWARSSWCPRWRSQHLGCGGSGSHRCLRRSCGWSLRRRTHVRLRTGMPFDAKRRERTPRRGEFRGEKEGERRKALQLKMDTAWRGNVGKGSCPSQGGGGEGSCPTESASKGIVPQRVPERGVQSVPHPDCLTQLVPSAHTSLVVHTAVHLSDFKKWWINFEKFRSMTHIFPAPYPPLPSPPRLPYLEAVWDGLVCEIPARWHNKHSRDTSAKTRSIFITKIYNTLKEEIEKIGECLYWKRRKSNFTMGLDRWKKVQDSWFVLVQEIVWRPYSPSLRASSTLSRRLRAAT